LGKPIVAENKTGAEGNIGAAFTKYAADERVRWAKIIEDSCNRAIVQHESIVACKYNRE
jgi:tripartite-type tricarboxylate transporter receptor subunit TctC